ncbi:MAG: TraR/DksA family transcriptional regulator [Chitinophagaceae bacterium]|nr:TraR/DksA family transcriptional regulator [Chitinophagaceae bacterium]
MATKKKAAKPAKKSAPVKKAPAKKPAAKSATPVKAAKSKPAPKKAAKPASAKKPVAKPHKPAPAKHKIAVAARKTAPATKPIKKTEVKKAVMPKKEEKKKVETKKVEAKVKKQEAVVPPPPKKPTPPPAKPIKVVIPEIKTKTARKYEPEFTKSVLDQPAYVSSGPTMRYSDAELQEFRELIQKKLDQAKKELAYLQGLITRKDEMGGDENENRYMTMEDGSMSMEREQLAQMASRQINYIDHLEKAIMRIENRTYGICRITGKLIDKARLRAVPHATLSIEAKQMMSK